MPGCTESILKIWLTDGIHNSAAANILLGERVARVALWQVYQGKTKFAAASLQQVIARESDVIQLIFKDQSGMLVVFLCTGKAGFHNRR